MPKDVRCSYELIGPNAILQLLPFLDRLGGRERRAQILARAGVFETPDGLEMIPEGDAARLHRQLRIEEPELAPVIARHAGAATGAYILAHRIPEVAQMVLKVLPPHISARLLAQAIARHAWTFAGSGRFRVVTPHIFEIDDNPLIAGERSQHCLCHWHAAVFEQLYRALAAPDYRCVEVSCGAQGPGRPCRFELSRMAAKTRPSLT